MKLWHNGEFKDEEAAIFPASDRIRLGDGVFDTMLVLNGVLIHATKHFERLKQHAAIMQIDLPLTSADLQDKATALLKENKITDGRYALNTMITRGSGARGLALPETQNPQIIMRISPVPDVFPPINAIIAQSVRRNEGSPLSQIKSINYGDNILAMIEATDKGVNEAIMLNNAGHATCASAGNIFVGIDGTLFTPPLSDGAMDGITRELFIERYGAKEKSLTKGDLTSAQNIILTNSIRGAVPLASLNGKTFNNNALEFDKDFHVS